MIKTQLAKARIVVPLNSDECPECLHQWTFPAEIPIRFLELWKDADPDIPERRDALARFHEVRPR